MWVNNGSQAAAAKIVIERLDGRPLRLVTQFDAHSGGVHNPAITQVSELLTIQLGVVIRSPQNPEPIPQTLAPAPEFARPAGSPATA